MNVHKGVFIVGLAGSGKSTLGKQVAEQLGYKFIDLDARIEEAQGMSIPDIFQKFGEGQFRIWEHEALKDIMATEDSFILATGGGAPCFHFNMDAMNEHGLAVYLDVNPGDLALRILDGGVENRPMFKSYDHQDLIAEIREMLDKRSAFYEQAKIKIRDNQINAEMIISNIRGYLN